MDVRVGDRFGRLALKAFEEPARANDKVLFRCDCGVEKRIRLFNVAHGITVSCGCVKRKHGVSNGQVFGRLTVINQAPVRVGRKLKALCLCRCGTTKLIGIPELATGDTKSCGCLVAEQISKLSLKHGGEGTAIYSVWSSIKRRCSNPKVDGFSIYGGRGISVDRIWSEDFAAFRAWATLSGYKQGLEIDRIDVNGNYEPSNCRWVTTMVNGNNRRNNVRLEAFGEVKTMADWSRDSRCAVSYATLKARIHKGRWTNAQDAICTPPITR